MIVPMQPVKDRPSVTPVLPLPLDLPSSLDDVSKKERKGINRGMAFILTHLAKNYMNRETDPELDSDGSSGLPPIIVDISGHVLYDPEDPFVYLDPKGGPEQYPRVRGKGKRKGKSPSDVKDANIPVGAGHLGGGTGSSNNNNHSGGTPGKGTNAAWRFGDSGFDIETDMMEAFRSSLYVQLGSFFPKVQTDDKSFYNDHMINLVASRIKDSLSPMVNPHVSKSCNKVRLAEYLSIVSKAVQVYLTYWYIHNYALDEKNTNIGIRTLASYITPLTLDKMMQLRIELSNNCLPPKIVKFLSFMFQNFKYNKYERGTILRLIASNSFCFNRMKDVSSGTELDFHINELRKERDERTFLLKAYNNWKIKFDDLNSKPYYSEDFLTFWHNSVTTNKFDKVLDYSSKVDSLDSLFRYCSLTPKVDMTILSCHSIYAESFESSDGSSSDTIFTGIWKPFVDYPVSAQPDTDFNSLQSFRFGQLRGVTTLNDVIDSKVGSGFYINGNITDGIYCTSNTFAEYFKIGYINIASMQSNFIRVMMFLFFGLD